MKIGYTYYLGGWRSEQLLWIRLGISLTHSEARKKTKTKCEYHGRPVDGLDASCFNSNLFVHFFWRNFAIFFYSKTRLSYGPISTDTGQYFFSIIL